MEPELTQGAKDFAIFMELYVEPTFALFYYFGVAVMGLLNFLSYVVTFLAGM